MHVKSNHPLPSEGMTAENCSPVADDSEAINCLTARCRKAGGNVPLLSRATTNYGRENKYKGGNMEGILVDQIQVISALVLVNVILNSVVLIICIFTFAKVRLVRKFMDK